MMGIDRIGNSEKFARFFRGSFENCCNLGAILLMRV